MRCSPDSSTTNESSPPRPAPTRAAGSRNSAMSVESRPGKSLTPPVVPPPAWRRRQDAKPKTASNATSTPAGTHQFAVTQSIQEPESTGTAGFFATAGAGFGAGTGAGVGVDVFSAAGGRGAGVGLAAGLAGCASTFAGVGLVFFFNDRAST